MLRTDFRDLVSVDSGERLRNMSYGISTIRMNAEK